jgi:zinc/manganese transport system permease protein
VTDLAHLLVEPGFLASGAVRTALVVGGVAAVVSGVVGTLTVVRGQSFAGHALADVSSAGGSAAFLVGLSPLVGFLVMAGVAAGGMQVAGARRAAGRDLATGVVLGAGLGLAALLLYLDTTTTSTTGAAVTVMFGSMFAISPAVAPWAAALSGATLVAVAVGYRPLLLASAHPDLASVRGVRVWATELLHLTALAVAVALSALTVGAILGTALLVGPAATALHLARRPGRAIAAAAVVGLATTWLGILLAYDSYDWGTAHRGWPVSFFIVSLVLLAYLLAAWRRPADRGPAGRRPWHRRSAAGGRSSATAVGRGAEA